MHDEKNSYTSRTNLKTARGKNSDKDEEQKSMEGGGSALNVRRLFLLIEVSGVLVFLLFYPLSSSLVQSFFFFVHLFLHFDILRGFNKILIPLRLPFRFSIRKCCVECTNFPCQWVFDFRKTHPILS